MLLGFWHVPSPEQLSAGETEEERVGTGRRLRNREAEIGAGGREPRSAQGLKHLPQSRRQRDDTTLP